MAYTGGELNLLNGKHGISAPANSVPVMKLISAHRPKSRDELYGLIQYHYEATCKCGIRSKGRIEDFGKKLYDAQFKEWGQYKYSLKDCIQWEYDLFVTQSLKGNALEHKAKKELSYILKTVELNIEIAKGFIDEELRVDLLVVKNTTPICGIQVKPLTFKKMRKGVIIHNKKANQKWGKPVFYLFYNEMEEMVNMDETVAGILKLV